jgi:aryl-alcohol dehydrogenase-like predicted oxidoreductase
MGYGEINADERIRAIHCAIDHGLTSIDTAPLYGYGEVEDILGRAITGRRDKVQILGKCGLRWDSDYGEPMFPASIGGETRMIRRDSRPDALRRDIESSLKRLQIEAFDLMQIHEHDRTTPLEATLEALTKLQRAGKIRAIGVSNFTPRFLAQAHDLLGDSLFSTQNMFNLLDQTSNAAACRFAANNSLQMLCYSPFAQGALAGKLLNRKGTVDDWRSGTASFEASNVARMHQALRRYALPITEEYDITLPQLVLEATLTRPGVTQVIVGARTTEQIETNARALQAQVPHSKLDAFAEAMRRCGFNRLAGEPWPVRLKATLRRIRGKLSGTGG